MARDEHPRDIALALSGGGYRAVHFHLGVFKKLHFLGLLDRVGVISCVSGGSILAGMYATNRLNGDSFETFVDQTERLLERAMPLDFPVFFQDLVPWVTRRTGLERGFLPLYRTRGRPVMMSDLDGLLPHFVINTTAVHSGAGWRFRPGGKAEHWDLGHTHGAAFELRFIEYECDVSLAKAVAASAAFPTFSAVTIHPDEIRETGVASTQDPEIASIVPQLPRALPKVLSLSDGGVLDNSGVTSILSGAVPADAPNDYYLIVSDGGGVAEELKKPPRGRLRKFSYVLRQFDLRGQHNALMTSFLALRYHRREIPSKGIAMVNISAAVPHAGESLQEIKKLASIKTRLKRLSRDHAVSLEQHGADLLWTRVSEYMPGLLPPDLRMPGATPRVASDVGS